MPVGTGRHETSQGGLEVGVEVKTEREREEVLRNGVMINMKRTEPIVINSPRSMIRGGK